MSLDLQTVQTLLVFLLAESLAVHPLSDEAVGDGMFWRKPADGGVASLGRSLYLQSRGDFLQTEPASVLQLCAVHVQLDNKQHSRSGDTSLPAGS